LELRPIVASSSWTCASLRPIPLSVMVSSESATSMVISTGASGSVARRAVTASTAFCSSSRT
jgi:hypothetical protein